MNYLHSNLGHVDGGAVVEVTLRGHAANVLLLDSIGLSNYRAGRGYSYHGGHFTHSPARIKVPHAGSWHVIVDLGGATGTVDAGVRVLSGAR